MVGEPKVVVGAKIEKLDPAAVGAARQGLLRNHHAAALRRGNRPLALPQARLTNGGEFGGGVIEEGVGHRGIAG